MDRQFPWQFTTLLKIINIMIVRSSNLLPQSTEQVSIEQVHVVHTTPVVFLRC